MNEQATNWAGNIAFGMRHLHRPRTVADLQDIVAGSDQMRVLGTGHSFNAIADTPGDLIGVADLPETVEIAADGRSARVSAGTKYGIVAGHLQRQGYALHNLGSLPHISVGGACSTGTHGSGSRNGSLPTAVRAIELVTADGSLTTISRGDADFLGSVVALGSLGVVTHLTLDIEPTYEVEQTVYVYLPRRELYAHLLPIMDSAYSVSLFTDWRSDTIDMVWLKHRVGDGDGAFGDSFFGATPATVPMHPISSLPGDETTPQFGVAGPWHERLPHFRLQFNPSAGEELQSEYFVTRDVALEAIRAIEPLGDLIAPVLLIGEIRTVAADELWLSGAYQRDTVALHFTWRRDTPAVLPVLTQIEAALAPYDARPHWGKVFTTAPEVVRSLYPRFDEFASLQARYDPKGAFRNAFADRYLS